MNTELETYFDNYNELFNHEGFKQLLQELSNNAQQLADIQSVKDVEELFYRKGQVAALASVGAMLLGVIVTGIFFSLQKFTIFMFGL